SAEAWRGLSGGRAGASRTLSGTAGGRAPPRLFPGCLVALIVALELGEGGGERVLTAGARLHYVVEVADVRGAGRGLDRRQARVADRAGRQAHVCTRVVCRADRELTAGERLAPVAGRVPDRRIDPQRHPFPQAVVDH